MRKAKVYFQNRLAGYLIDKEDAYSFQYEKTYLQDGFPISVTLPLREEEYLSDVLHPFFDGLIIEGWLLKTVEKNWKMDPNDRFGLLMLIGKDTIGAVSVEEVTDNE